AGIAQISNSFCKEAVRFAVKARSDQLIRVQTDRVTKGYNALVIAAASFGIDVVIGRILQSDCEMVIIILGAKIHDRSFKTVGFIVQATGDVQGFFAQTFTGFIVSVETAKAVEACGYKATQAISNRRCDTSENFILVVGCSGKFKIDAQIIDRTARNIVDCTGQSSAPEDCALRAFDNFYTAKVFQVESC